MVNNVTIVIRTAGERTVDACYDIIAKQVPEASIFVLAESPFSKAVVKTFEIGIKENKQWTIAIDADWLLTDTAISEMVAVVADFPDELYIYQGMILDYLYGEYRFNGPHLYNTQHLHLALQEMSTNPNELRPESYTYRRMAQKGFFTYCDTKCYALHDYDQYLKDYYRKGFFHAKKAFPEQLGAMLDNLRKNIENEPALHIALNGLMDGVKDTSLVEVDISYFEDKYAAFLKKEAAAGNTISETAFVIEDDYVARTIAKHKKDFPKIQPESWVPYSLNRNGKIFHKKSISFVEKKKSFISRGIAYMGRKLISLSKKMS